MSWHCSQALVAEYSAENSSDGALSALSSETPMQRVFLPPDRTTAFSQPSLSGMTFEPLTDNRGEALLTWYLAASRAKTSAPPEPARESTVPGAVSGQKWRASFAKYIPDMSSWKTAQCSLLGDSDEFSETWPRWGSMRDGECWERTTPALIISETESGYWPTPQASDGMRARMKVESFQKVHADARGGRSYLGRVLAHEFGLPQSAEFTEWLMIWPEGWTDLRPLGTVRFREWLQQHSIYFQEAKEAA